MKPAFENKTNWENLMKNALEAGEYIVGTGILAFGAIKAVQLLTGQEILTIPQAALIAGVAGLVYGLVIYLEAGKKTTLSSNGK